MMKYVESSLLQQVVKKRRSLRENLAVNRGFYVADFREPPRQRPMGARLEDVIAESKKTAREDSSSPSKSVQFAPSLEIRVSFSAQKLIFSEFF